MSRRRRRSSGSAGPVPELFTPCVHFSKCSRDLGAKCKTTFGKKCDILGTFGGSPPLVAPEGGSASPRAKPRLTQCNACVRAPEDSNDSEKFKSKAYFFIVPGNLRYEYKVCTNNLEFQG